MTDQKQYIVQAPPGYAPEIGGWLWALEDTRHRTKRALQGVSDELLDWVPPKGKNSIGTILYHIAAIEMDWLHADVLEGQDFPPELNWLFPYDVRDVEGKLVAVRGESLAEHLERLDRVRAHFLKSFRGMSTEEFRRQRIFQDYQVTPEWVIHHLMQHEGEHRGQIGELRLLAEQRNPEVGSIAWTDLTVANAEEMRDFYHQVIGWEPEAVDMDGYSDFNMNTPVSGTPSAGICHSRGVNADLPPVWLVYFTVSDLDQSISRCIELGGKVLGQRIRTEGGGFCVIQDPAGAAAALFMLAP